LQAAELAARNASAARAAASTAAIGKSSSFYGVSWSAGDRKWRANVNRGGKSHQIDQFDLEEDAARAVDEWLWNNYGEGPKNFDADDNRIVQQSTDASIYRGITRDTRGNSNGSWMARIWVGNKYDYIGTFDTQEEAAKAYDERAWKLDKPTNFRLDGTRNDLGTNGKVRPQRRTERWTPELSRQSA
jgi:hypothetical protein